LPVLENTIAKLDWKKKGFSTYFQFVRGCTLCLCCHISIIYTVKLAYQTSLEPTIFFKFRHISLYHNQLMVHVAKFSLWKWDTM